jgi:hypothetical protein
MGYGLNGDIYAKSPTIIPGISLPGRTGFQGIAGKANKVY